MKSLEVGARGRQDDQTMNHDRPRDVIIDKCEEGHTYPRFADHPLSEDNKPWCPYCMADLLGGMLRDAEEAKWR